MIALHAIEGTINRSVWFHYAVSDDVLYLRLNGAQDVEALGEETDDGLILLRDSATDRPTGLTIVNWWKRFGQDDLTDWLMTIERHIQPWGDRIAA